MYIRPSTIQRILSWWSVRRGSTKSTYRVLHWPNNNRAESTFASPIVLNFPDINTRPLRSSFFLSASWGARPQLYQLNCWLKVHLATTARGLMKFLAYNQIQWVHLIRILIKQLYLIKVTMSLGAIIGEWFASSQEFISVGTNVEDISDDQRS